MSQQLRTRIRQRTRPQDGGGASTSMVSHGPGYRDRNMHWERDRPRRIAGEGSLSLPRIAAPGIHRQTRPQDGGETPFNKAGHGLEHRDRGRRGETVQVRDRPRRISSEGLPPTLQNVVFEAGDVAPRRPQDGGGIPGDRACTGRSTVQAAGLDGCRR